MELYACCEILSIRVTSLITITTQQGLRKHLGIHIDAVAFVSHRGRYRLYEYYRGVIDNS